MKESALHSHLRGAHILKLSDYYQPFYASLLFIVYKMDTFLNNIWDSMYINANCSSVVSAKMNTFSFVLREYF